MKEGREFRHEGVLTHGDAVRGGAGDVQEDGESGGEDGAWDGEHTGGEGDDGDYGVGSRGGYGMIGEVSQSGLRWQCSLGIGHANGLVALMSQVGQLEEFGRNELDVVIHLNPNVTRGSQELSEGPGSGSANEGVFADGIEGCAAVGCDEVGNNVQPGIEAIGFDVAVGKEGDEYGGRINLV